jgi:hypothetical protein
MTPPIAPSGLRRTNRPSMRSVSAPAVRARTFAGSTGATCSGLSARVLTLIMDPRIEDGIERVDRQIDDDDQRDDDEVHSLDHGIVALVDRVE